MQIRWLFLGAAAAIFTLPGAAAASHLDGHVFTFDAGPADPYAWCVDLSPGDLCDGVTNPATRFASSGWSGRYLGNYETSSVSLTGMDYLGIFPATGRNAYLSFDLLLTGFWHGNGTTPGVPDFETLFKVVANGTTLLDTSFANKSLAPQSYPEPYPQGTHPAGTGAAYYSESEGLSVYHFDLVFNFGARVNPDVSITFDATFGPGWRFPNDVNFPKWGVDNVVVSSRPIPEPASGALVGLGLLAFAARHRRA